MTDLLSFAGLEPPRAATDKLMLQLKPSAQTSERLADLAAKVRRAHGLSGELIPPDRQHITLHYLGNYPGLPPERVAAASAAAASVKAAPFDIVLDRAGSFGAEGNRPLVLQVGEGLEPLTALWRSLNLTLAQNQFRKFLKSTYAPHLTLLYDRRDVPEHPIDPIRWTINEITLVHGLWGEGRHVVLGRWRLG